MHQVVLKHFSVSCTKVCKEDYIEGKLKLFGSISTLQNFHDFETYLLSTQVALKLGKK